MGPTGFAQLQSNRNLRYRPGHEGSAFFTAQFSGGSAANSTQWIGLFDNLNGAAVGYTGTTFSILFRQNGVDTTTPQSSFNRDKLNGTGPSGFTINPQNINVFRISYGWLGAAPINFQVIDQNGEWITFHQLIFSNTIQGSTFYNPTLPITAQVLKTAGTTNLTIGTASWNASLVGEPSTAGSRFFGASSGTVAISSPGVGHLMTIINNTTFNGVPNKVAVRISLFTGGTVTTASETSIIQILTGATVTGLSFTSVSPNSVVSFSTVGTYSAGTGTPVLIIPNNTFGSGPFALFLPQTDISIILLPGQTATVTGQSLSGAGTTGIATLTWEEMF